MYIGAPIHAPGARKYIQDHLHMKLQLVHRYKHPAHVWVLIYTVRDKTVQMFFEFGLLLE